MKMRMRKCYKSIVTLSLSLEKQFNSELYNYKIIPGFSHSGEAGLYFSEDRSQMPEDRKIWHLFSDFCFLISGAKRQ